MAVNVIDFIIASCKPPAHLVHEICTHLVEGSTGNPRRPPYGSQKHILLFPLQRLSFRCSSWLPADGNHVIDKLVRGQPSREKIECVFKRLEAAVHCVRCTMKCLRSHAVLQLMAHLTHHASNPLNVQKIVVRLCGQISPLLLL